MKIILVRVDGDREIPFVLETPDNPRIEPEFLIGRAPDCNLCIPEDRVSRHHCGLIVDPQDLCAAVRPVRIGVRRRLASRPAQ